MGPPSTGSAEWEGALEIGQGSAEHGAPGASQLQICVWKLVLPVGPLNRVISRVRSMLETESPPVRRGGQGLRSKNTPPPAREDTRPPTHLHCSAKHFV